VKPTVALTGANGFIGSRLAEELLSAGYAVRCLLRPQSRLQWIESLPVDLARVSYGDPEALARALEGCMAVLHFGGATKAPNRDAYFMANAETTHRLLEASARACPGLELFLLCSSQAALGPSPGLDPLSEDAPPHPLTAYGQSKLEAERICREWEGRLPVAVLRPPAVYGPRDKDIFIFFQLINRWISPSIGPRERYFSLVHVEDVAQVARLILEQRAASRERMRIYHVTDGAVRRWSEVAQAVAAALDRRPVTVRVPLGVAAAVGRIAGGWSRLAGRVATLNADKLKDIMQQYWLMSCDRTQADLGYVPRWDLASGIAMTARWYKEKGWL